MKRAACSAFVIFMASSALAQKPIEPPPQRPTPQASTSGKPNQYAMTLKGCVSDKRLTLSEADAAKLPFEMLRATEFTLTGSPEAIRQLREHIGHDDEIAGVVSVPPERRPVVPSVDAKKLGPFSVGVGGRESIRVDEAPRVLTLKVESVTHLRDSCVERR